MHSTTRSRSLFVTLGLVTFTLLVTVAGPAVAEDLMPAAEVLDRYIEMTGGADLYAKFENRVSTGTLSIPAMGMTGQLTQSSARPDLLFTEIELPGLGTVKTGFDGDTAWEINPMTGARVLEGAERAMTVREATFNGQVKWQDLYASAETTGKETLDDGEVWVVVMTPHEGGPETRYYDTESGLLLRIVQTVTTPMGEVPLTVTVGNYKEFDGLLIATRTEQDMTVQTMVIELTKIEHDVELAAGTFDLPAAIVDLATPSTGTSAVEGK